MKISIKTSFGLGRTYDIEVDSSNTIREVKGILNASFHHPNIETLALVFDKELLYDDDKVEDYDIQAEATLELTALENNYRNFGNSLGMKFVNVSDNQMMTKIKWSTTAPPWRRTRHGLCLEGQCPNSKCKAYKCTVIMPIGFKKFDILKDSNENTTICPSCRQYVEPQTCAFNNCWWRYIGVQNCKLGPPKPCSSDWKQVDDAYYRFDEQKGESVTWRELILEAVRTRP